MYCPNCGKQIDDSVKFCPHCGNAVSISTFEQSDNTASQNTDPFGRPSNSASNGAPNNGNYRPDNNYQNYSAPPRNNDSASFGWGFLGFLIPIVGLILYLVWKDEYPLRAKSCGKGALISVILYVVIMIIYFIVLFAAVGMASQSAILPLVNGIL